MIYPADILTFSAELCIIISVIDMNFLMVEALWQEEKNFVLDRDSTGEQYIFTHFLTPVTARLDGKDVLVKPGGCIFFGMNSKQHFASSMCSLLHNWFHADSSCGELMQKYGLFCNTVYYPESTDEITSMINEIELEYINKLPHYRESAAAIAENMFIKIARSKNRTGSAAVDVLRKEQFIKARAQIHMSIQKPWTAKSMAELVNLSESQFHRIYKQLFGISPQKDLIYKRIRTAVTLLSGNDITVEKTAELCGYSNPYHFIRQFKQITGTTPGKLIRAEASADELTLYV